MNQHRIIPTKQNKISSPNTTSLLQQKSKSPQKPTLLISTLLRLCIQTEYTSNLTLNKKRGLHPTYLNKCNCSRPTVSNHQYLPYFSTRSCTKNRREDMECSADKVVGLKIQMDFCLFSDTINKLTNAQSSFILSTWITKCKKCYILHVTKIIMSMLI